MSCNINFSAFDVIVERDSLKRVIIPFSQYVKLNFSPSAKSNQIFNPSKLKYD